MPAHNALINVLIVDDEPEACTNLENIVQEYMDKDIHVLGTCHNTREAERFIGKHAPDAVFLDIEMPNENAFGFLERVGPVSFEVIFVTAYDEYAIRAFKLNALDYILKPISIPELKTAIHKLRERVNFKKLMHRQPLSYNEIAGQVYNKAKSHKITLKDNNAIEVVDFKDIYFIEAQGSYIRIVFLKESAVKEVIMSGSLTEYEELLPANLFFRIHKSYVINCAHVKKILKDEHNQVAVNNFTLPVSRRRYTPLLEFLKSNEHHYE
jgi:two-component system LytT family response regulator